MTVTDRINNYRIEKGFKMKEFETLCGLSNAYLKNTKTPGFKTLEQILTNCPDLNREWLLTGDGPMLKNLEENSEEGGLPIKSVPYWNLPVTAGRSLEEIIGQTKPDGYITGLPGADLAENILPVIGTSMDPEVSDGALIGVRKMNNWETLNTERIYLIITNDERMIKRIEHDAVNEAILWCTSPNYAKFKIYKSDIIEIQRVCFVYNPK